MARVGYKVQEERREMLNRIAHEDRVKRGIVVDTNRRSEMIFRGKLYYVYG